MYLVPLVLLVLFPCAFPSFCGPAAVPFSFEALPNGQPVLGCARPTCFGWNGQGKAAGTPSTFYRVNKKPDGYFRKNTDTYPKPLADSETQYYQPQVASCAATFDSDQCASETQWVGGIGPMSNLTGLPLALQCCDFDSLLLSQDRGIAGVKPGQIVIGGEILNGERQYAFDYISDLVKNVGVDRTVSYDVYIRRLPCLPQPDQLTVKVEPSVYTEIGSRFAKKSKFDRKGNKAFQAPLQEFGENNNVALASLASSGGNGVGRTVVDNQEEQGGFTNTETQSVVAENQEVQSTGQIISQSERVVLEPTGQETVEVVNSPLQQGFGGVGQNGFAGGDTVVQGPFVADGEAVEVVDAVQGLELPEGQVPEGLIQQPAAGYGAAPAYSGGYGGVAGGRMFCFSADTMVKLEDGTEKRMDHLEVNDWVLSANRTHSIFSPVESWIHRLPQQQAEFYHIHLAGGKNLKITGKHFIYKTKCDKEGEKLNFYEVSIKPVFAEKVTVGDCLYAFEEDRFVQRRVERIDKIVETGIYAPMTTSSDIVVNDVFASCYNILHSDVMQKSFFNNFRKWTAFSWLMSESEDEVELPAVTSLIVDLMEFILPKSLV